MTQQEILEYNKRCVEFLGLYRDNEVVIYNMKSYTYKSLKFHSDWNWIMEIVETIRQKGWMFDIEHHSSITSNEIGIIIWRKFSGGGDEEIVQLYHKDYKILHILAINQFLIWNEKNKI
jgi:hypothetical protein